MLMNFNPADGDKIKFILMVLDGVNEFQIYCCCINSFVMPIWWTLLHSLMDLMRVVFILLADTDLAKVTCQ